MRSVPIRLRAALARLGFAIGLRFGIRRRIVLATAHLDAISGNLAFIERALRAEALREGALDVEIVVLARRPRRGLRPLARAALDAVVAGWHLATARLFVVDDYYFPMYVIRPRRGTRRIQVWHAAGAFKKFGYSVLNRSFGADESFVAEFPIHTNYDLCLVSAERFAPFYAEAFREPLDRFTSALGIPRTDIFFDLAARDRMVAELRDRYRIPRDRRVILYAPTFRGERITLARSPNGLDLERLREAVGTDHVLLLRAHPFAAARTQRRVDDEFAIDVSDHPDINELMLVSDVLLTDYSSAMYEFALLERPIAFFAPDADAYLAERGFYLDFPTDLPGPVFETTDAVAAWLRSTSRAPERHLERVRAFRAASFDVADGRATERFVDRVVRPSLRGEEPLVPTVGS